jgi:hypothetical protein
LLVVALLVKVLREYGVGARFHHRTVVVVVKDNHGIMNRADVNE